MVLQVKRLSDNAILPAKGSPQAAGYDLYATESMVLMPGRRAVVPTGISIKLPSGTYGRIAPRSGLAVKHGIQTGAGVVDPDYTGEIKVVLFNQDRNTYVIHPGYRVSQLVLEKYEDAAVEDVTEIPETTRGEAGFGSTGVSAPIPIPKKKAEPAPKAEPASKSEPPTPAARSPSSSQRKPRKSRSTPDTSTSQ